MPESDAAANPSLTLLRSSAELSDGDLAGLYAYPEREGTWLRANFIASVDGGATADGKSGVLGGPGDRSLFNLLRELADVIVVGAGTVRAEGYSGAHLGVAERQRRQARGQREMPPLAVVTGSGHLDRDLGVFTQTEVPPLVLTSRAAVDAARRHLTDLCEVVDCSAGDPHSVDPAALLAALRDRGMRRVLTEGGPTLLGAFIERELLDELCLTVAPYVVGGSAQRICAGPGQVRTAMRCAHVLTDGAGYLYTRYVRA